MLSLVLPAFNEAHRLTGTLSRCFAYFSDLGVPTEVIVVDDGSTDTTADVCRRAHQLSRADDVLLRYQRIEHRGKGAAVRSGVQAATGDPIAFLDADLTVPLEVVGDLLAEIERGADIAVASRYVAGAHVRRPWWRTLMGNTFRLLVSVLVPTGLTDTQCGGKAYRAEVAHDLFIRQSLNGFAFDTEVLFLARRAGYRIAEVPVDIEQRGSTRINFIRDVPRMVLELLQIRLNDARGRYG